MNLETMLQKRHVPFERHVHSTTFTSQGLADAEHVSGYMVAKPVIVKSRFGYAMCVVSACDHVDLDKVGTILRDKDVQLATESEMTTLFPECEIGAEPPVGALFGLKTIMDLRLRQDQRLMMQAGSHTEAMDMSREDWESLCQPIVADIRRGCCCA
jgi:Ala-tRNA(Pro) deacylase